MSFEYDPSKSDVNKEKRGIDFVKAQQLWADNNSVEFLARVIEEFRYVVIGLIDNKHWTAVITYRNENIRIISVRRSRGKEIEAYESRRV